MQFLLRRDTVNSLVYNDLPWMKVAQIKEKFGGLRFYVDAASERQQAMIDDAQARSFRVCEICGTPGSLVQEAWMRTRCADHVLLNSFEHGQMRAL